MRFTLFNFRLAASIQCAAISSRRLEEKLGLPAKPKRPLSCFLRFVNEKRPQWMKENPGLPMKEFVQKCGKQWTSADKKTKKKYENELVKDNEEYQKQLVLYNNQITDEQKTSIEAIKRDLQVNKEKRAYKMVSAVTLTSILNL